MAYNDRKFDFPVLKKQASGYKIRVARTELLLILALLKITARARGLQWPQIRFPGIEETSNGIHCRKRHGGLNRKKHRNEKPFRRWIYKNTKSIIYFTGSFAAFFRNNKNWTKKSRKWMRTTRFCKNRAETLECSRADGYFMTGQTCKASVNTDAILGVSG